MSKVIVSGQIYVPLASLEQLRPAIATHVDLSRAEAGCLAFNLEENRDEPGRFDLYEEFVDSEAFEVHKRRTADSQWGTLGQDVQKDFEVREVS